MLVLDGSAALAWFFGDEQTAASRAVLTRVANGGAVVPGHWRLEVANALQVAVRRKRIAERQRDACLADLGALDIRTDEGTNEHAWGATLALAARHGLSLYDAAYAELARRSRLPLATGDREIVKAARAIGIDVIET